MLMLGDHQVRKAWPCARKAAASSPILLATAPHSSASNDAARPMTCPNVVVSLDGEGPGVHDGAHLRKHRGIGGRAAKGHAGRLGHAVEALVPKVAPRNVQAWHRLGDGAQLADELRIAQAGDQVPRALLGRAPWVAKWLAGGAK